MENEKMAVMEILDYISPRIRAAIKKLSNNEICEIRLRCKMPVVIVTSHGSSFLTINGRLTQIISEQCIFAEEYEITDTLNKCCGYSLHTYSNDIINGFVTLSCGARVGVCGTAVYENNMLKSVKDISCLNIRIPRNIRGVANEIINYAFKNDISNLLIVGPPGSGKTTIIKDLAYQISDGILGKYYKVCIIDERLELSSDKCNLGPNTDVIRGFSKEKAISLAVRTMSPEIIICDEVGLSGEINEILNGINCGVNFVITAHSTEDEMKYRNDLLELCKNGRFNKIAFLDNAHRPGKIMRLAEYNDYIKDCRNTSDYDCRNINKYNIYTAN